MARLRLPALCLLASAAACSKGFEGPAPSPASTTPSVACVEQVTTTIAVAGTGLSPMPTGALTSSPKLALPQITLVPAQGLDGKPAPAASVTVPDDAGAVRWTSQQAMAFDVSPSLALTPGLYDARIANPDGKSATLAGALLGVPRPTVTKIEPDLVCDEQSSGLTLTGDFFLQLKDGTTPAVKVGNHSYSAVLSDCRDLPGPSATKACLTAHVTIPTSDVPPGSFDVVLVNPAPAACSSTDPQKLAVVPAPTVATVVPDLTCVDDASASFTLTGTGFLSVDTATPSVLVGGKTYPATLDTSTCSPVATMRETVSSCTSLSFTIPKGDVAPGTLDVHVQNPAPADCTSATPRPLTVIPAPKLEAMVPDLVCLAQGDVAVKIHGQGFLVTSADSPTLTIGDHTYKTTAPADASSCAALDSVTSVTEARLCTEVDATLKEGDLPAGLSSPTITNPAPAACVSKETVGLEVLQPPVVTSVQPIAACDNGTDDVQLAVDGQGFLVAAGQSPKAKVGSVELPTTVDPASCTAIAGIATAAQTCTHLTTTIPAAALPPAAYQVVIENPEPAACNSSEPVSVHLTGMPKITSVVPSKICSGGGALAVSGSGFDPAATVTVGGLSGSVQVSSPSQLSATFGQGLPVGGPYDLVVQNAPGCSASEPASVQVVPGPQIFFADPPVVYSGISTQVLLYVSGVSSMVKQVGIRPAGTTDAPTMLVNDWSAARPNRVQVVIPKGTTAGTYDVLLSDATTCEAVLLGNLKVTDTQTVSLASIDPPFGWTGSETAVTVLGEEPLPTGKVGLIGLPRLYLNPTTPDATTIATPLSSVSVLSPTRATAVVPSGLTVGSYDLIAVNSDGTVGVLLKAFSVDKDPPPSIDTITPGTLPNGSSEGFEVLGQNLRSPTVSLSCKDDTGTVTQLSGTASGATTSTVNVTVNASGLANGALCVVRVTDDDGSYADFSALTFTSPSQNLGTPVAGTSMSEARRAPAVLTGNVTSAARFLFAAGGDGGATSSALASVETAPVDVYGVPGAFFEQREQLPGKRTLAGSARIGRFLYLVGGDDGSGATDSVLRAFLLDPADRNEITDLSIDVTSGSELAPGIYSYRVAPLMDATDALNPGGEDLPSEPFPVVLPDLGGVKLSVTLTWSKVTGAAKYRIYRTPKAGDPAGSERLLAEVDGTASTFLDDGSGATTAATAPLPLGSTGAWKEVAHLVTAREGAGVTAVATPANPSVQAIYVMGGKGTGGTVLSSMEQIKVTVATDRSQTVATPVTSGVALATARWELGAVGLTHDLSGRIDATQPYVYALGGMTSGSGGNANGASEAFPVGSTGALGTAIDVGSMNPARAGFGAVGVNNFLYAFGGQGGSASKSVASAENCGPGKTCTKNGANPPYLVNWNSEGVSLVDSRVLMGTSVVSGVIYLVGGSDGVNALSSTEHTHW